jgi:hypothetical protein
MNTASEKLVQQRVTTMEALADGELSAVDGGLNAALCIPVGFRPLNPGSGPNPSPPAPFRDVFAKYTIGPV